MSFPRTNKLKIGTVPFFNAKPLSEFLGEFFPDAEIVSRVPAELENMLLKKELDLALLSSFTFARHYPKFQILPEMGIISKGAVRSVNLFLNPKLIGETGNEINQDPYKWVDPLLQPIKLNSILLDPNSRSSNALVQIMAASIQGNNPKYITMPSSDKFSDHIHKFDGVLAIGDRALALAKNHHFYDLGQWWYSLNKLPFVFALWIAQSNLPLEDILPRLILARDKGQANLDLLVDKAIAKTFQDQMTKDELKNYLSHNIRSELDAEAIRGMKLYFTKCHELGLIQALPEV